MVKLLLAFILIVIVSAFRAQSHNFGYSSSSRVQNGYISQVGLNIEKPIAQIGLTMDFHLLSENSSPVDYDRVDVVIERNGEIFLRQTVIQTFGVASIVFVFPTAGKYKVTLSYRDANGDVITRSENILSIEPHPGSPLKRTLGLLGWFSGIGLALFIVVYMYKRLSKLAQH